MVPCIKYVSSAIILLSLLMLPKIILAEISNIPKVVPAETSKPWKKRSYADRMRNGTYEDWFSFKNGLPFSVDPFVWVYSKEFAERYHMPKKWVDNDLKGFMAAAWTMNTLGTTMCGLSGIEKNCWKPLNCQLDVYYDNTTTALPWGYPEIERYTSRGYNTSTRFIVSPPERLDSRYGAKWGRNLRNNPSLLAGGGTFWQGKYHRGYLNSLYAFDKNFEPGIGYITWIGQGMCPEYTGNEEVSLKFVSQEDNERLDKGKLKWNQISDKQLVHKMIFPQSFLVRANKAYKELNKQNQDTMDRLKNLFFERQK